MKLAWAITNGCCACRGMLMLSDTYLSMPVIVHEMVDTALSEAERQPQGVNQRARLWHVRPYPLLCKLMDALKVAYTWFGELQCGSAPVQTRTPVHGVCHIIVAFQAFDSLGRLDAGPRFLVQGHCHAAQMLPDATTATHSIAIVTACSLEIYS